MRSKLTMGIVPALLLVVPACAPVDAGLGEAVKYDMAVQTVNPEPQYPADGAQPGDSGEHAADATKRYRDGNVTDVKRINTQRATGSGGGGGGGGG